MDFKYLQAGGWLATSLIFGNLTGLLYSMTGLSFLMWLPLVSGIVFGVLAGWGIPQKNHALTFFICCLLGAMLGGVNGTF